MKNIKNSGFTIVELMIALAVLSTVLIISSSVVINLGALFVKGINQTNTQNTARNIVNELANQLQLGSAVPIIPPGNNVFCLGSQRYSYVTNVKLTSSNTSHVLWRDTMKNSGSCAALGLTTVSPSDSLTDTSIKGSELLATNMRIMPDFGITDNGNGTYTIRVTVAYGDDDLIQTVGGKTRCIADIGKQYCAVSSLVQTVSKRGSN